MSTTTGEALEVLEVARFENASASIIWLHGLGADGHDFEAIVPELRLPQDWPVRFVFPHAPYLRVSVNQGARMRAWYDIQHLGTEGNEDLAGLHRSVQQVSDLIEKERLRGVDSSRIVLAGFSQGGAVVLETALRYPRMLAGVMLLSSYRVQSATEAFQACNQHTPYFIAHGRQDSVIPLVFAQWRYQPLLQWASQIRYHEYDMPHSVCSEEIKDIRSWLLTIFPPPNR